MSKIIDLFKHRDEVFVTETQKLLNEMPHVVDGATTFINNQYGHDTNRKLVWQDVILDGESITLIGIVNYAPGTRLMFNDEMMDITPDNSEYFQQLIRVGIPLKVVHQNSEVVITSYLDSLQEQENNNHKLDFDLSELTEEQRKSLITPNTQQLN